MDWTNSGRLELIGKIVEKLLTEAADGPGPTYRETLLALDAIDKIVRLSGPVLEANKENFKEYIS